MSFINQKLTGSSFSKLLLLFSVLYQGLSFGLMLGEIKQDVTLSSVNTLQTK